MPINKKINELPNIPSPSVGDLIGAYSISGDFTGNITFTQAIQLINDNGGNMRVGFNPVPAVFSLSGIDVTDYNVYFNNGIINAGGRMFYLDRNSTLAGDGVNVLPPLAGPGNFIAFEYIVDTPSLFYSDITVYDNLGELVTTYTEYGLKSWKYINGTPTDEAARVTALGAGNGTPQENVYWTEISKSEIPNLGGDVSGTLNNVVINKATVAQINSETAGRFIESENLGDSKYLTQDGSKIYAVASGTDTYTATLTPAITAYVTGATYYIKFTNANTGSSSLNLNGIGAKIIKKSVSTNLASGDILAGQIMPLNYDGTNFQIIGGGGSGGGGGTLDTVPTNGSTNGVESNGVFDALSEKLDVTGGTITVGSGFDVELLPGFVIITDGVDDLQLNATAIEYTVGGFGTFLVAEAPTANRTLTLPNQTGKLTTHKNPAIQIFMHQNFI